MAERKLSNLYRGKTLYGGPINRDGPRRRILVVFAVVCAVFCLGLYGLYRLATRGQSGDQSDGAATTAAEPGQTASGAATAGRPVDPAVAKRCDEVAAWLRDGKLVAAAEAARNLLAGLEESDPAWERAARLLGDANLQLMFSDVPLPDRKLLYTVKPGDALVKIAQRHQTTVAAIQRANRLDPNNPNIRIGQTLCLYPGQWAIKVSKSRLRLYLYDQPDHLFKFYPVGIGHQGRTPSGTFAINNKLVNPDWDSPKGRIPYGAPGHELGTRWLGIVPTGDTDRNLTGYGIHGTWDPNTIGKESSNGCVRMLNEDVNELHDIVPYRTPVTIVD